MISQGGHNIDVGGIETFVKVVGQGMPLLVVHGGPGFSHEYLVDPLSFLTENRILIFYDQPGCGKTVLGDRTSSPSLIYKHLLSFTRSIAGDSRIDLLAHSWGTLVVLGALAQTTNIAQPTIEFGRTMFVNPVSVTNTNYKIANLNLIKRMPESILTQMEKATQSEDSGAKIMELILPYYYSNIDHKQAVRLISTRLPICL